MVFSGLFANTVLLHSFAFLQQFRLRINRGEGFQFKPSRSSSSSSPVFMAAMDREPDVDELQFLIGEQRRELKAMEDVHSDSDFAFILQLQEALSASLALHTSAPPPPESSSSFAQRPAQNDSPFNVATAELSKFEQEALDRRRSLEESRRIKEELRLRVHDERFARQVASLSDDEWCDWGDNFERPFGEGSSKFVEEVSEEDCEFRVYFKGLVSDQRAMEAKTALIGIGVAICDFRDNLILEIKKPLVGVRMNKQEADVQALLEGLEAASSLELNRVEICCDFFPIFQFVKGRWKAKQRKVALLMEQVSHLRRKFEYCEPVLIARNDVKFAFKLAREALISLTITPAKADCSKTVKETCVICLEDTDVESIFSVDGCLHRFCYTCMKQHVEVKLRHGMLPLCPHENCKSELPVDTCRKFLASKMLEMLAQRKREASIPPTEKVYCPYPRCSALMSRNEISENAKNAFGSSQRSGARKCLECHGLFCISCLVPWHSSLTCYEYKRRNPNPSPEDLKLKSLAKTYLWRQCVKCNHLIELSEGCYHMTCRCGYEFCYNCGAEWKNKKATCSCPLWDEDNILHEEIFEDEEEEEEEEDSDDEYWL